MKLLTQDLVELKRTSSSNMEKELEKLEKQWDEMGHDITTRLPRCGGVVTVFPDLSMLVALKPPHLCDP